MHYVFCAFYILKKQLLFDNIWGYQFVFPQTATALRRNTRSSAHDAPLSVHGPEIVTTVPLPHYPAGKVSFFFPSLSKLKKKFYNLINALTTLVRQWYGRTSGAWRSYFPCPKIAKSQCQSTIPDVPNRGGYGLSNHTLQPQIPELRASNGTPSPSLRDLQPHHTFRDASYPSGFGLSTVTHQPGISALSSPFETIRLPQYELQSQSVIPGDPHLSDPATFSVTPPSVIPFPSVGTLRTPPYGAHSQNVIPAVPYLNGLDEEVETRTVSKKKLPTSSRQLPDKKDYQSRIF